MAKHRKHIGLKTKLASALLALGSIPYEDAKQMTAHQLLSLYHFDHGILHGVEEVDAFWNLTPRLIAPHRRKSAIDTGIVAKVVRVEDRHRMFCRDVLGKPCGHKRPKSRWTSRPFGKKKAPARGRG